MVAGISTQISFNRARRMNKLMGSHISLVPSLSQALVGMAFLSWWVGGEGVEKVEWLYWNVFPYQK